MVTMEAERIQELFDTIGTAVDELHEKHGASVLLVINKNDDTYGAVYGNSFAIAEALVDMIADDKRIKQPLALALNAYELSQEQQSKQ